ncbi:MAG: hypothetical protein RLZZ339_1896 [Cyanobacteriota bacterium]|jgi:hypothetical protein|uniref:Uncharacterized protein n=1 Tax=Microcystis aeruginosa NIES-44 TaxID=449439 RepID=A0A0A1VZM0_MICAE|nr:hypothetical protein N44_03854 [Microcystis aeruginosa NIES-44]
MVYLDILCNLIFIFVVFKLPKINVTVQGGGCQAASGIDSVEGLSWGSREGEELPFLEAWILLSHSSRSFLRLFRLSDFVPP